MDRVKRDFCGLVMAIIAASMCASSRAEAATCPGTQGTIAGSMLYTVTTAPTDSTCVDFSNTGTLSSNTDPFLATHSNYLLLDATNNTLGVADGALSVTGGVDGHGTFTIDTSKIVGYSSIVIAIQDGQGPTQIPVWGAFLLGNTLGNWAIQELEKDGNKFKGLSDAVIYGVRADNNGGPPPNPVPLPPAFLLFGAGLMGLTVLSRRRRKA
jgi:hypothetical protein